MPKFMRSLVILLALAGAALASPALAKNVVADIPQIAALLKKDGKTVEIKKVEGEEYIRVTGGGYGYSIFTYGCDDKAKNCKSVQFFVGMNPKVNPTLEAMNTYARENRWGRIYLDKDGDPAMEFDVDLEQGGMSEALFLDNVAYWEAVIDKYGDFVFGPNGENNNEE
jgi:Putative bacterial sensory transduction regulator